MTNNRQPPGFSAFPTDPAHFSPASVSLPFQIEGHSGPPGDEWTRRGSGTLRIIANSEDWILEETGSWAAPDEEPINFTGRWHWIPEPDGRIHVGHLRHSRRTFLLTLTPAEDNHWHSSAPHLCGPDEYLCQLLRNNRGEWVYQWTARGPAKNYRMIRTFDLHYRGRPA